MAEIQVVIGHQYSKGDGLINPGRYIYFSLDSPKFAKSVNGLKKGDSVTLRGPTAFGQFPEDFKPLLTISRDDNGAFSITHNITKPDLLSGEDITFNNNSTLQSLATVYNSIALSKGIRDQLPSLTLAPIENFAPSVEDDKPLKVNDQANDKLTEKYGLAPDEDLPLPPPQPIDLGPPAPTDRPPDPVIAPAAPPAPTDRPPDPVITSASAAPIPAAPTVAATPAPTPAAPKAAEVAPTVRTIEIKNGNTIGRDEMKELFTYLLTVDKIPDKLHVTFKTPKGVDKDGKEIASKEVTVTASNISFLTNHIPALKSFAKDNNLSTDGLINTFIDKFKKPIIFDAVDGAKNSPEIMVEGTLSSLFTKSAQVKTDPLSPQVKVLSDMEKFLDPLYPHLLLSDITMVNGKESYIGPDKSWKEQMLDNLNDITAVIEKEDKFELKGGMNKLYNTEQDKKDILTAIDALKTKVEQANKTFLDYGVKLDGDQKIKSNQQNSLSMFLSAKTTQNLYGLIDPDKIAPMRLNSSAEMQAAIEDPLGSKLLKALRQFSPDEMAAVIAGTADSKKTLEQVAAREQKDAEEMATIAKDPLGDKLLTAIGKKATDEIAAKKEIDDIIKGNPQAQPLLKRIETLQRDAIEKVSSNEMQSIITGGANSKDMLEKISVMRRDFSNELTTRFKDSIGKEIIDNINKAETYAIIMSNRAQNTALASEIVNAILSVNKDDLEKADLIKKYDLPEARFTIIDTITKKSQDISASFNLAMDNDLRKLLPFHINGFIEGISDIKDKEFKKEFANIDVKAIAAISEKLKTNPNLSNEDRRIIETGIQQAAVIVQKEVSNINAFEADIAAKSKDARRAIDSINEDIKYLDTKQQDKARQDLDKLIKEGNKDIFEKKGSPDDLLRRLDRNVDNINKLQERVVNQRLETVIAQNNELTNGFLDFIKSSERELKDAQKDLIKIQEPLNVLFARSDQLKKDFENAKNFSDSERQRQESNISKEMVTVSAGIREYEDRIKGFTDDVNKKIIDNLGARKNQVDELLNKNLADIPVNNNTGPSAGYLKAMSILQETRRVISNSYDAAITGIMNNPINTERLQAQLEQHKENTNVALGGFQQDKSIFQNTVDMFNLRRYQTALIEDDKGLKTHDTYNFWSAAANIIVTPFKNARDFIQGDDENKGITPMKVLRGAAAVIGFPVVVAISVPKMIEYTFKSVGNFCNAVGNAFGTAVHGVMSLASAAVEKVGELCDKGVAKLAEVAADKEAGIGARIAAKAGVLTVGTVLKVVAAGCHITGNALENTGIAIHEVGTLVGAALRLPTVPLEAGTSLRMVGSSFTRAIANTVSIATSAVETVGGQIRDFGDKLDIPVISTVVKFAGNAVEGIGKSAEAIVQGTGQILRGEALSGGKLMVENIADAGRKVAQDIDKDIVKPIQGKTPVPELETKVSVKHDQPKEKGELKENVDLKELNERVKITGGKQSSEQLFDLQKASYDKSHQEKNAEKVKASTTHSGDHGR